MERNWLIIERIGKDVVLKRCLTDAKGEITIPSGVTSIGNFAFNGCGELTSIKIPDSVTNIGKYAFRGCVGLKDIFIPKNVANISTSVFAYCSNLKSIQVDSDNKVYDSRNHCNCIIKNATNSLVAGSQNALIPHDVSSIDSGAFEGCSGLKGIAIPDGVTRIGATAFSGCNSIENIVIPNNVVSVGWKAFEGCSNLNSVTVSNSVTSTEEDVFRGCRKLKNITILGGWSGALGCLFSASSELYEDGYLCLETLNVHESVKTIESQDLHFQISCLDFHGSIPETNNAFKNCVIEKLRVNASVKQTEIPPDILEALQKAKKATVVYAAPELREEESSVPGYFKATRTQNDELIDINTQYVVSVEPCRQEKYHPVNGSLITLAAKNKEIGYQIVAYEPSEVILKRIENSLESLSKKVGGVAGLINMLGLLYKKK